MVSPHVPPNVKGLTSTFHMDLEEIIQPISDNQPCGVWLRYEGTYDRIQEARREDDPDLDQGVWITDLKKADWERVERLCLESLAHHSKDVQIAAWLMEAWIHRYGLAGARKGLEVIFHLCEDFWPDLYPPIEHADLEARIGPFIWMNEKLTLQLKQIPITCPSLPDLPALTWSDWEHALRLENLAKRDPEILETAKASGRPTREDFMESATQTPSDYFHLLVQECEQAQQVLDQLDSFLDSRCEKAAPGFSQFKSTIQEIKGLSQNFLLERRKAELCPEETGEENDRDSTQPEFDELPTREERHTTFRNRAHAYQCLNEAAEYLHNMEPHSPTPYLIKRAVSWGNMTLAEVMQDMATSGIGVPGIYALLGLPTPGPSADHLYDDE